MKLIPIAWSYGILILKLLHYEIKFILGNMKPHVNSLLEKLGCQKKNPHYNPKICITYYWY